MATCWKCGKEIEPGTELNGGAECMECAIPKAEQSSTLAFTTSPVKPAYRRVNFEKARSVEELAILLNNLLRLHVQVGTALETALKDYLDP